MEKIWLKNYSKNTPPHIDVNQYSNILDILDESVKTYSKRASYSCMGKELSYSQLDKNSDHFASFLQNDLGLKKGDKIAIQIPNTLAYPVVLFGALKAGLIIVSTNPLYTEREMEHQFNDSGATTLVILENFAHKLEVVLPDTPIKNVIVTRLGDFLGTPKGAVVNFAVKYIKKLVPAYNLPNTYMLSSALKSGSAKSFTRPNITHDDTAFLQYTGGTTGVSKGAELTHKNLIANMLQVYEWIKDKLEPGKEVIVTPLPLYHIFSLSVNALCFLKIGATNLLITNPRDIKGFIKILKKNYFSAMSGVNTLYNALMNHEDFASLDFSNLKASIAGGMALQTSVALRWKEITQSLIVEGYGLTEASPVVCINPLDGTDRVGTIGLPISSTEIMIADENGNALPVGQEGEICVRGPQIMRGYWKRPEETAKTFFGDWLRTGDVAIMDNDGFCKIVDRMKDMILVSGFNVYPNEVEEVASSHDEIIECAAVGVKDEHSGEVVKLFVVLKPGSTLNQKSIREYCKQQLVAYKVPKTVEIRDELPKSNVGKILRRHLRES